jgi:hypothetical protein
MDLANLDATLSVVKEIGETELITLKMILFVLPFTDTLIVLGRTC